MSPTTPTPESTPATEEAAEPSRAPLQDSDPDPVTLEVVPWTDPVMAARGHDPRSEYVERFWLPVLGPSVTWLLRRFARGFEELPGGFRIELAATSRALGLGEGTGRHSMITRSLDRACQFGMAQRHGRDRLAVRTHLPPLTQRQVRRLPLALQRSHDRWVAAQQDRARSTGGLRRVRTAPPPPGARPWRPPDPPAA